MPPRGTEGLDFTPVLTHYLFLFTTILAVVGWFLAFISQAVAQAQFGHTAVGTLWFAIFLQLFLILGVLHTLATDSIAMHRFQISVFGAVAIVFAVHGVDISVYSNHAAQDAMAAGWLILAIVDILWTLYFTSEEDSLLFHLFNSLGTGGLTPPSRRRRRTQSVHNMSGNGYTSGYAAAGSLGPIGYDAKTGSMAGPIGGAASFHAPSMRSAKENSEHPPTSPARQTSMTLTGGGDVHNVNVASPLMGSGAAGLGAGGGPTGPLAPPQSSPTGSAANAPPAESPINPSVPAEPGFRVKARALYNYKANEADHSEISFDKGEILEVLDRSGKWWTARRANGREGIAPSNYLQVI